MTTLYGIKNCDTVKKARKWLESNSIEYTFHDFRVDGLDATRIKDWETQLDLGLLINKRSTTWKQLDDAQKALFDQDSLNPEALKLIEAQPTLIKRPVLDHDKGFHVGFKDAQYSSIFK